MKMVRWLIPLLLLATQVFAAPVELDSDRNGFLDLARGGFNVNPSTDPTAVKTILGLQYVSGIKHNFSATIPPTANTDSSINYSKGSLIVVIPVDPDVLPSLYVCRDATEGAAVWELVSGAGGSAMTPQEIVDAIDTLLGSNTWQAGGGTMTNAQVKTAYEANADTNAFTDNEKTKLAGVTAGATANASDAFLLARSNHTGTQSSSTISDAGATGRSILAAATPAEAQAAVGTIADDDARLTDTRDPNAHQHDTDDLSASTAFGRSIVEAVDAAAGRTAMGTVTGYEVNQLPPLQDLGPCTPLGVCSDVAYTSKTTCEGAAETWTPYDSQAICTTNGGSWGSAVGYKFSSANFDLGNLTVDGETVYGGIPVTNYGDLQGIPIEFTPVAHTHSIADVTGLQAALDAATQQINNFTAALAAHGIDTTAPVLTRVVPASTPTASTSDSYTLNYTVSDPQGLHATTPLYYRIGAGADVAMTSGVNSVLSGFTPNTQTTVTVTGKNAADMITTDVTEFTYQTPVVGVSPGSKAFADTNVGSSSATQQFTWSNTGLADATGFSLPALGGTDPGEFGLSGNTCTSTLAAGANCTANVVFSPTSAGAKSATVSAGGVSATLSGTGVATIAVNDDFSTNTAANYTYSGASGRALTVSGGVASGQANWVQNRAIHTTTTGSDNHYVQAKVMGSATVVGDISGVILRSNGVTGAATGYIASLSIASQRIDLRRFSADVLTGITNWSPLPITLVQGTVYPIKVTVSGSTFTAYIDANNDGDFDDAGENLGTRSDSTYTTGAFVGLIFERSGGSSPTADDLKGSAL